MADNTKHLTAQWRTEFGKGAARRTRAAGMIPAVLYGHGADTRHLSLPAHGFANAVRGDANQVLTLDVEGEEHVALPRMIVQHPIKDYYEHVDLLTVRKGDKVTVEVPVHLVGEAAPGTLVLHDLTELSIEVGALAIPENLEASIEGVDAGENVTAADITLPADATLVTPADDIVVAVQAAPSAEEVEAEDEADATEPASAGEGEGDES